MISLIVFGKRNFLSQTFLINIKLHFLDDQSFKAKQTKENENQQNNFIIQDSMYLSLKLTKIFDVNK
jgi:hypothetical protein